MPYPTRRDFLQSLSAAGAGLLASRSLAAASETARKKLPVAGVTTVWRHNSHADVILGKVVEGYQQDGGAGPGLELASLYTDQVPKNDLSRPLAKEHGFEICESIDEALTLGSDELQVAGVLLIGEHGDYPYTQDTHQHMYPRRRLFDAIAKTFRRCGQVVPVFNDKHLAYDWKDAEHIWRTVQELEIPLLAGSSLPVAWRVPPLELEKGCRIEDVMAVGYGGLESYGFHTLEVLQCMVERRAGGETGVKSVETAQGDEIWQAEKEGRWSRELLDAALEVSPNKRPGELEQRLSDRAAFYFVEYRDGLKATVAMANGVARDWAFSTRLAGENKPRATCFAIQDGTPYLHFAYLVRAIEHFVRTGRPPYPAKRTLLTTGVLDAAMHSLAEGGTKKATPHLKIAYEATDWPHAEGKVPAPRG